MNFALAPHWLDLLCRASSCGPAFRRSLDSLLTDEFIARVGVGLEGFMLVPPPGGIASALVDEATGIATLSTDLVGPNAEGYPVTLAWQAAGISRPLPEDPALELASTRGEVRAWWDFLPETELHQSFALPHPDWQSSRQFPFDAKNYPFTIEWKPFPWPHIWLRIKLSGGDVGAALHKLVQRLQQAQASWNLAAAADPTNGIIHQVGSLANAAASRVVAVNVDFGSARPAALLEMLQAIGQAGVPIAHVVIGSSANEKE